MFNVFYNTIIIRIYLILFISDFDEIDNNFVWVPLMISAVVSNKSRTVCSDPDSKCYDISNTLAWYVFYFNELLKNVAYFKINAIILGSSPIDLLMVLYRVVLYCTYMHPCIYTVSHTTVQLLHRM